MFDDEKCGRPCETSYEKNTECARIVKEELRITTRKLSEILNMSKGSVGTNLSDCGIRKLASRFSPCFLTMEMCQNRLECCSANLRLFDEHGDNFLKNIITEDETPLSLYLPESKRESAEWKFPGESVSKKLRSGTSHRKSVMLSIFWDYTGVLLVYFAGKGVHIYSTYYSNLIQKFRCARRKSRG